MIFNSVPNDWKDLQNKVGQIFSEIGCIAEIEKTINTARGTVNIDVYVTDRTKRPELIYLCECKQWNNPVPQTVVHSFQTVVQNSGAHLGYIISKNGFQSGAYEASKNTNIKLVTWVDFQSLLFDTWKSAMLDRIHTISDEYSEYFDFFSGPPRDTSDNEELNRLFSKYYLFHLTSPYLHYTDFQFPISCIDPRGESKEMKEISVDNYRDFFDIIIEASESGINVFKAFRRFLREKHGRD